MKEEISNKAGELARDLDTLSGERIIEHLITAQVKLQRENAELNAKLDKMLDQLSALAKLVDIHELALEKVGIMRAAVENETPGGIVH
jgi:hypothetical protein